jgi:3-isopropylmalate dehydrogenase
MSFEIVVLPGDGIGPEVTAAAVAVLQAIGRKHGHDFRFSTHLMGGSAIDATGEPLPAATLDACRRADAILLGAVGGPKWSDPSAKVRPEQGLLALRQELGLYANLRPVRPHPVAMGASPVKPHLLAGVDLLVVRELTGGLYFGEKQRHADRASDARAAASWPRWTRPTCWKPRASGAKPPFASAATNTPTWHWNTTWWTRWPCT